MIRHSLLGFKALDQEAGLRHTAVYPAGTKVPMTHKFRDAFLDALNQSGLSLRAVAIGSGVSESQLKKLKQRENATTNVDDAKKVAEFFGLGLDTFLDAPGLSRPVEIVELYSRLPHRLKQEFQAYAAELSASAGLSGPEAPEEQG